MARKRKSKRASSEVKEDSSDIEKEEKENERCSVCQSLNFQRRQGIQCDQCDYWYHRTCVKLSKDVFQNLIDDNKMWLCPTCSVFRQPTAILSGSEDEENALRHVAN